MEKRPHEKLEVWQKSVKLAEEIYKISGKMPPGEIYGLTAQMRRSAVSVASNIAEGSSRQSKREFKQFLYMARGSLSELETQIIICLRIKYLGTIEVQQIMGLTCEIGKMLTGLIKKWESI